MRPQEAVDMVFRPEYRRLVARTYKAPFILFLEWCAAVHFRVKDDPKRQRRFVVVMSVAGLFLLEIVVKGVVHFSEGKHWWDFVPIGGSAVEIVKALWGK